MPRDPFESLKKQPETPAPQSGWAQAPGDSWGSSTPEVPSYLDSIPAADWQPKKRTDRRPRGPVLFVRNIYDLKEPLAKIAQRLDVPRDMLVRYLLEYGLEQHIKEIQPLQPVLNQRLTLYPEERPPGKRCRKAHQKGVGFRGIPQKVIGQIGDIAEQMDVPTWQVVRQFLERGLKDYRAGHLAIHPTLIRTETYTLYPENHP